MKKNILKVTLDEITPDKIGEIEEYLLQEKLSNYIISNLKDLGDYRIMIKNHYEALEAQAKSRAIRAVSLGIPAKEVGELLGIPTASIKRWTKK